MALGDNAVRSESLGRSFTTSAAYQHKLDLATPAAAPGTDFFLMASWAWQVDTGGTEFQAEIQQGLGPAAIYETGVLRESNEGVSLDDSLCGYAIGVKGNLPLGSPGELFHLNFRRQSGTSDNSVAIREARLQYFELDATFQEAISDAASQTNSTTYQLKVNLNTGAIPAGDYRIGFAMEYKCQDPTDDNNIAVRFRERRDPAGANVITNLLGDDSGAPDNELEMNNGGFGVGASDPLQQCGWWVACRTLVADTYEYEVHFRAVGGAFDDVEVQKARLIFWRTN